MKYMKKQLVLMATLLLAVAGLRAQNCATGFCPETITVHHAAGNISPETVTITYNVEESTYFTADGSSKCWLTQNLGASTKPASPEDYSAATLGWYWQFMRKQGFTNNAVLPSGRWVNSAVNTTGGWGASTDPCRLLLGGAWRLPTMNEVSTARTKSGSVYAFLANTNFQTKCGYLESSGQNTSIGSQAWYWYSDGDISNSSRGRVFYYNTSSNNSVTWQTSSGTGASVRCIMDL